MMCACAPTIRNLIAGRQGFSHYRTGSHRKRFVSWLTTPLAGARGLFSRRLIKGSRHEHCINVDLLRSQVAELSHELAERDQRQQEQRRHRDGEFQDLRKQAAQLHTIVAGTVVSVYIPTIPARSRSAAEERSLLSRERFDAVRARD